jgi:hypothetical protein
LHTLIKVVLNIAIREKISGSRPLTFDIWCRSMDRAIHKQIMGSANVEYRRQPLTRDSQQYQNHCPTRQCSRLVSARDLLLCCTLQIVILNIKTFKSRFFVGEVDKIHLTTFFINPAEKTFVLSSSFLYPAKTYLTMVHKYF